jgi:hypothetical protein
MAMLIALQIVLSKFLMIQLTVSIRLSIDSVPILLSGIWFRPAGRRNVRAALRSARNAALSYGRDVMIRR